MGDMDVPGFVVIPSKQGIEAFPCLCISVLY